MDLVKFDFSEIASFKCVALSYFKPCCAAIAPDGTVLFFNEKGDLIKNRQIKRNGADATDLSWCSAADVLAIGWSDGIVTLFADGKNNETEKILENSIKKVIWHPALPILLAFDVKNNICVWENYEEFDPIFSSTLPKSIDAAYFAHTGSLVIYFACKNEIYKFEEHENEDESEEDGETGEITLLDTLESNVSLFEFTEMTQRLIVCTEKNNLHMYKTLQNYQKIPPLQLVEGTTPCFTTIRADIIAYSTNNQITVWNPSNDQSLIIRAPTNDAITSIHFDTLLSLLIAITSSGVVIVWKCTMKGLLKKEGWSSPSSFDARVKLENVEWSRAFCGFTAKMNGRKYATFKLIELLALTETVYQSKSNEITANNVPLKTEGTVLRMSQGTTNIIASENSKVEVFSVRKENISPAGSFKIDSDLSLIINDNIYTASGVKLEKRNIQGTVSSSTSIGTDSPIMILESCGNMILVVADDLSVFVYDASRRDPKLVYSTSFSAPYPDYRIRKAAISASGFCAAFLIDIYQNGSWRPSPYLFLYSPQFDKTTTVSFGSCAPFYTKWDNEDPRLLCVQVSPFRSTYEIQGKASLVPLFVDDSLSTFKQPSLDVADGAKLSSMNIPNVLFSLADGKPSLQVLPQFEGIDSDESTKKSLMEFNFNLAAGDIDSALNSARNIPNKNTWSLLAQTCIKKERIDLIPLCLGKLGDAPSSMRVAREKDEVAKKFYAMLALGDRDNAKRIAEQADRTDLIIEMLLASDNYKEAINLARRKDRFRVPALLYQYGRSQEVRGNLSEAIKLWEEANVLGKELPRAALQADKISLIFKAIEERNPSEVPKDLYLWVGRFFEAHNVDETALSMYLKSNELEYIRLLCVLGKWDDAENFAKQKKRPSLVCSFARLLIKRIESMSGETEEAKKMKKRVIDLFLRAKQFAQAMDYAISQNMEEEILTLSYSAPQTLVVKAARFFEEQKLDKQAILMYARAGRMNRALGLCFSKRLYDALDDISDQLNANTDQTILMACGSHFLESGRWSKAAECFALARQFEQVERISKEHNVKISKQTINAIAEVETDPSILSQFATLCEKQGENSVAATLYVKMKDLTNAVKCLVRAGDTQKVVKFAKLARNREIYVIAANYLQTLDVYSSSTVFDLIVYMLNKANCPDKLARFYDSLARECAEEHQEYDRAFDLLKQSVECMMKAPDSEKKEKFLTLLRERTRSMAMYIEATKAIEDNPQQALAICASLLKTPSIDQLLKLDDIYIVMIEAFVAKGSMKNAFKLLDDMHQNGTDILFYLDLEEVQAIYRANGKEFVPPNKENDDDVEDVDDLSGSDIEA